MALTSNNQVGPCLLSHTPSIMALESEKRSTNGVTTVGSSPLFVRPLFKENCFSGVLTIFLRFVYGNYMLSPKHILDN